MPNAIEKEKSTNDKNTGVFDAMSKQKWDLTDAAIKRIDARITELRRDDNKEWYLDPVGMLMKAMKPEWCVVERNTAEELIQIWIREGHQSWLCAACFKRYASDRHETREAARNVLRGLRQLKELDL